MDLTISAIMDTIYYLAKAGGPVMLPIYLVGAWGFYLVFGIYNRLGRDFFRKDFQVVLHTFGDTLNQEGPDAARQYLRRNRGLVFHLLHDALEKSDWSEHRLRKHMLERMSAKLFELDRGMHMASVLAGTAPLLGLLGTVTGMVSTFQVITLYGNTNPVLLADGISEALITTQSGLIIAFPLVLALRRVEERSVWIKKQMELGMTIIQNWAHARTGDC